VSYAVNVNAVNDAPEASDDSVTVMEDGFAKINVLGNDQGAESDSLISTMVDHAKFEMIGHVR
jgi:large repetitive protein